MMIITKTTAIIITTRKKQTATTRSKKTNSHLQNVKKNVHESVAFTRPAHKL
jgi:hypothetical protein